MMKLSKRLELVASFVPDNSHIIDVGCDHALLAIYLTKTLKNVEVTASDINPKPLEAAKLNISKYNLDKKIKVVLKDGINDLPSDISTVVISGMGGILISKILDNKKNLQNVKTIVVSPNNDFPLVRKTIKKIGFKIVKEELVIDNQKIYLVIKAILGHQMKIDYLFGTLNNKNLTTIGYYSNLYVTNSKNLKSIPKKYFVKRYRLKRENSKIKKFMLTIKK